MPAAVILLIAQFLLVWRLRESGTATTFFACSNLMPWPHIMLLGDSGDAVEGRLLQQRRHQEQS
jgi:hypothetical protein